MWSLRGLTGERLIATARQTAEYVRHDENLPRWVRVPAAPRIDDHEIPDLGSRRIFAHRYTFNHAAKSASSVSLAG